MDPASVPPTTVPEPTAPHPSRGFTRAALWITAISLVLAIPCGVLYYRAVGVLQRATLRLVDDTGQPAVGLEAFAEHSSLFRSQVVDLGTSDENGRLDLSKLKELGVIGSVEFVVRMVGFDTPEVSWQEDMTIVVPRHGEVTLQLVDGDDEPWTAAHAVDALAWMHWADGWGHRSTKFDERGRAALGAVACDCSVTVNLAFHLWRTSTELTPPPPGEHAEQRLPAPDGQPSLRGVLAREDGEAISEQVWLRGSFRSERGGGTANFSAFHLQPEANGRFEFLLGARPESGSVTIADSHGREATIRLRPGDVDGAYELGVVQLTR